jgi:hypothetical protein
VAQSKPPSCPADRPVDDIIAEVNKQQSKKTNRDLWGKRPVMGADLKVEFKRKKNSVSYEQLNLNLTELSDIAYELDVTPLDEMISIGEEEVEQAAAVEGMTPAAVRKKMVKWFAPEEPLASVEALVAYLRKKKNVMDDQESVIRQLEALLPLLQDAKQNGVEVRLRYFL